MKTIKVVPVFVFLVAALASAQDSRPAPPPNGPMMKQHIFVRTGPGEMGKWWKDSETASKLQLGDDQLTRLDQIFYDHRMKLIDYTADMEKQDLKLQSLLDADVPNDGQVQSQVDQVLASRGRVEREYTMMNLDLRKVLSLDQWHQLKSIREKRDLGGDHIFFRHVGPGPQGKVGVGMPGDMFTLPAPPLPPEAGADAAPEPLN